MVQPPGSILQQMYLQRRFSAVPAGRFLEIGVGRGFVCNILLSLGWQGVGFDLSETALAEASELNKKFVQNGQLKLHCGDWLDAEQEENYDLIISCFVLEHLDDAAEKVFLQRCVKSLDASGKLALMLPANPERWSVEDEVAGHYRRYSPNDLSSKLSVYGLECQHLVGLNFPLTNLLQPLAHFLIRLNMERKTFANLSKKERTKASGHWKIPMLTIFPSFLGLLLNPVVMAPFYFLQVRNHRHPDCLVLYAEAGISSGGGTL